MMVGFLTVKLDAVLQVVVGVVGRRNPSQVRKKGLQSQHRKVSKNSVLIASRANQIVTGEKQLFRGKILDPKLYCVETQASIVDSE